MRIWLVLIVLCYSPLVFSDDGEVPYRSLMERMNGVANLPYSEVITLNAPIGEIQKIRLSTPERSEGGSQLKLQKKRSIVLIDNQNFKDLAPEIQTALFNVIANRSASIQAQNQTYRRQHIKQHLHFSSQNINDYYIFANFQASTDSKPGSSWFVAILPKTVQVERVFLQTEWFGSGAGAHNQIRMILDTPIIGIPQEGASTEPVVFDWNGLGKGDLIYTLNATRVEEGEQDWHPLNALMGEFGIALKIVDTKTLALEQIQKAVIDEHELLNLQPEQGKAILVHALTESDRRQELSIYNTVFASCVTYAMAALKAGIPQIDSNWFNPYSLIENVSAAHGKGTSFRRSAMNDVFAPFLQRGQKVMEWQDIQSAQLYQLVQPVKPLLRNPEFDQLIQQVALYIIKEGITYDQVKAFMQSLRESGMNVKKAKKSLSTKGKVFLNSIVERWESSQLGSLPIEDFFKALQGLQTQD